jgi:hypothetical protein
MTTTNTNSANRSYTIAGLTNDITYRIRVAAINSIGTGSFTQYVYATPSSVFIDNDFYNVELLLSMDQISNSDNYYGNDVLILATPGLGPNDDPYSLQTALLLHGDGIAIVDSSLNPKSISRVNSPYTVSDSRFGTGSIRFTGNNYLSMGSSNDFNVGTGDFTVELFIKFKSFNTQNPICNSTSNPDSADNGKWLINYNTSSGLYIQQHASSNSASTPWTPTIDNWYHLAITRDSGTIKMFIDGVEQTVNNASIFNTTNFNQSGFSIGRIASFGGLDAQIDEFRFTNGVARSISLPVSAYANPANPYKDLSYNSKTINNINSPTISTYSFLDAPTNIISSQSKDNSLTLNWTASSLPPGASDYIIQYSTDTGTSWTTVNDGVSSKNSVIINNLADGSYIFRIAATNGDLQSSWTSTNINMPLQQICVEYLVVAGGGGGGAGDCSGVGGGGGAGGVRYGSVMSLTPNVTYTVTVGGGGSSATNGSDSSFNGISCSGGGSGGTSGSPNGGNGGSGGGGRGSGWSRGDGGSGINGQGTSGGNGGSVCAPAGGGGGASSIGRYGYACGGIPAGGGTGGDGILWYGNYYGGGGGGSHAGYPPSGAGGLGGGGSGGSTDGSIVQNGTAFTGGGGGGNFIGCAIGNGGSGGSGIVVIRAPKTAQSTTGSPIITTQDGVTIYKFIGSGSITF